MEKAQKVKTRKSKEKYYNLAIEVLQEGLKESFGEDAELSGTLSQIEEFKAKL